MLEFVGSTEYTNRPKADVSSCSWREGQRGTEKRRRANPGGEVSLVRGAYTKGFVQLIHWARPILQHERRLRKRVNAVGSGGIEMERSLKRDLGGGLSLAYFGT